MTNRNPAPGGYRTPRPAMRNCWLFVRNVGGRQITLHDGSICEQRPDPGEPVKGPYAVVAGERGTERLNPDCSDGAVRRLLSNDTCLYLADERQAITACWKAFR